MAEGLATIGAAALAALASLLVVIITKEQKVSEFRQQWIDAFRADAAEFLAKTTTFAVAGTYAKEVTTQEDLLKNRPIIEAILVLEFRIRLRLNAKEQNHIDLIKSFEKIDEAIIANDPAVFEDLRIFSSQMQEVLKLEWKRVKKGEWLHRGAVIGLAIVALAFFVAATWVLWSNRAALFGT